ncbi:hypothetical protein D3C72_1364900 [compost metagenome]
MAGARHEQFQVVVQLRHGAHGGAGAAYGVGLVDGNGRGNALDLVYGGLVHAVEKLARIGTEGLDIATLAFGVQGVEHQARFARAARARHHRQFTRANVQIQILEVVLTRPTDANVFLCHTDDLSSNTEHSLPQAIRHPCWQFA